MAQTPDSLADEQRGVMCIEWRQSYRGRVQGGTVSNPKPVVACRETSLRKDFFVDSVSGL